MKVTLTRDEVVKIIKQYIEACIMGCEVMMVADIVHDDNLLNIEVLLKDKDLEKVK